MVRQIIFTIACTLLLCMVWIMRDMPTEADIADQTMQRYCEKVRLYKDGSPHGWPDYKRIYDKECE